MRICDANNSYSPTGGGVKVYHNRKLDYFSGRPGHSAALVYPGKSDTVTCTGGNRVYTLRSVPLPGLGYRMIVESGGLNSVFLDYVPDIVEIGSPYFMPALAMRALGDSRVPTVGFYHTDFPDSYVAPYSSKLFPGAVSRLLVKAARKHAEKWYSRMTAVFASSRCMLEKLRALGVTRLFHTPLGVDTRRFSPQARSSSFRRECGASESDILVLFMARLHWEKGLDSLIRAYPLFRDTGRIKLVIGGRGPHENLVNEFIREYPEVCRLPYQADRDAVARALASSDIYLSLGPFETFGLAGLEAVACGTVTVFPDAGAAGEMAQSLGLLDPYRSHDPMELARTVRRAVEITGPGTSSYLRDYAVSRHSWESVFRRIEGFYGRIIDAFATGDIHSLEPDDEWWEQDEVPSTVRP